MKKILIAMFVISLSLVIACGSGSKEKECKKDTTCAMKKDSCKMMKDTVAAKKDTVKTVKK